MPRGAARTPLPWLAGLLLLYLGIPIVAFCVRLAATHDRGFGDPGLFPALGVSALAACVTTLVATLLGVPLARLLARGRARTSAVIGLVVQLPLAVPPVMGGILLIYLVGPYTWLGRLFGGHLTGSLVGVVLAQLFVASPFLVVNARWSFAAIDPALDDVAATLGRGPLDRFLRVDVPAAAPGIRAGMVLTWLRAFGEYGATVVIAYHPTSLPVYTFTQFSATGLPGTMAPTALALGVAAVAVALSRVALLRLPTRRRSPGDGLAARATAAPRPALPMPSPVGFDVDWQRGTFRLVLRHATGSARLAVLGPSGSGKSTLLRCLAGLEGPGPGPVWFGDRRVEALAAEHRRVGYVAQTFGLFPGRTVWEQVMFAPDADPAAAAYWLHRLHLDGLEGRLPGELSGGQRQRVALAQALARSPDVLLLDEPFAALDTPVRRDLQQELRRLQRETGVATVLVTHDPEEAALLADDVVVVADGRLAQEGPTRAVYRQPASPGVARLVGVANLSTGTVLAPGLVQAAGAVLGADTGELPPGAPVLWSIRPELLRLVGGLPGAGWALLEAAVVDVVELGWTTEVAVAAGPGLELRLRSGDDVGVAVGDPCTVGVPAGAVRVWQRPDPTPSGAAAAVGGGPDDAAPAG